MYSTALDVSIRTLINDMSGPENGWVPTQMSLLHLEPGPDLFKVNSRETPPPPLSRFTWMWREKLRVGTMIGLEKALDAAMNICFSV